MKFDGKAVLITGASRGIGRSTARAFLDQGARVAINGRTTDSVERAMGALGDAERLVAAPGDVATVAGCEAVVGAAVDALGGLDILINSAGVFQRATMAESDESLWDWMIDANVKGTYFCSRAALPVLASGCGAIVNVASQAGSRRLCRHNRLLCVQRGDRQFDAVDGDGSWHQRCGSTVFVPAS